MDRWEYCSLQLEQKVGYRTQAPQTYRGVQVEPTTEAVWEVHSTLRLPGGDMRRTVFERGHHFVDEINKLGNEGWELAGVVDEKNGLFDAPEASTASTWMVKSFVFKRPL
jgi:hypothetical protein